MTINQKTRELTRYYSEQELRTILRKLADMDLKIKSRDVYKRQPSGYVGTNSKITFSIDSLGKTKNVSLKSDFVQIHVKDKRLHIDTNGRCV